MNQRYKWQVLHVLENVQPLMFPEKCTINYQRSVNLEMSFLYLQFSQKNKQKKIDFTKGHLNSE